jgi:hypothetical protein
MTNSIKALESLGFRWNRFSAWEDRLSELADLAKSQGTAMFLGVQRKLQAGFLGLNRGRNIGCTETEKTSRMTNSRVQVL